MKIAYITDIHGNKDVYDSFFSKKADAFILGGDISPNSIFCPIDAISNEDFLYHVALAQRDFFKKYFIPKIEETNKKGKDVYLIMGNDDFSCNLDLLEKTERKGLLKMLYDKKKEKPKMHQLEKNISIMGYCYVPITPFGIKDWEKYDFNCKSARQDVNYYGYESRLFGNRVEINKANLDTDEKRAQNIDKDLENIAEETGKDNIRKMIFVCHTPPFNTGLDRRSTYTGWDHVGSLAVKKFIEKYQPLLTLHGHIHESYTHTGEFKNKIGETVCVNPGASNHNLCSVIFDTSDIESLRRVEEKISKKEEMPRGP